MYEVFDAADDALESRQRGAGDRGVDIHHSRAIVWLPGNADGHEAACFQDLFVGFLENCAHHHHAVFSRRCMNGRHQDRRHCRTSNSTHSHPLANKLGRALIVKVLLLALCVVKKCFVEYPDVLEPLFLSSSWQPPCPQKPSSALSFSSSYNLYGVGSLNIRCGLRLARSNMVSAKTPFAHANQLPKEMNLHERRYHCVRLREVDLLVYEAAALTSMLSWMRPSFADLRTRSRHPMISSSSLLVRACMSKLIGQAFDRPI